MKNLPNFHSDLCEFVLEESRREALRIEDKDDPTTKFDLQCIKNFTYEAELEKFQKSNPLLMSAIVGTISKEKVTNYSELSRKGFGGPNSSEDIDLIPCVVQTAARILRNRHPRSISTVPCMTSLYLWANRVPGKILHYCNTIGDTYR